MHGWNHECMNRNAVRVLRLKHAVLMCFPPGPFWFQRVNTHQKNKWQDYTSSWIS